MAPRSKDDDLLATDDDISGDHRNKNFDRDGDNDEEEVVQEGGESGEDGDDDDSSMEEKENRAYYERRKRKFAATMDSSLNSNTESTSMAEDAKETEARKSTATVLATSQDHRKNENAWSRMSSFVIDGIVSMVLSRAED